MSTAADNGGRDALNLLKSTIPPSYLTPSPDLSKATRSASEYLFLSLNPYSPKSPFPHLLTNGFDAEQIWQQIDMQSHPLLYSLRRQIKNFENNPNYLIDEETILEDVDNKEADNDALPNDEFDEDESADEQDEEDDEDEEGDDGDEEMEESGNGVEDRFLKIDELEEYLEKDEAREYGLDKGHHSKKKNKRNEESDEDEDEDDDDDDGLAGVLELDLSDEDDEGMETARYDDFFGSKKDRQKKSYKRSSKLHELEMDEDAINLNDNQIIHTESHDMHDDSNNLGDEQKKQTLSTHEKEREKLQSDIKKMEQANLEPKTWTMQGEVTASKRPKNSALEVDLDFEHNIRPTPVITEEVTASLEELIRNRVIEGRFDDVLKPATFLNKAPRENVEMDENKNKEGLAKLYEGEYAQKTGLVSTALTFSDEQKKEASQLFKKLCLKLDAISHFHFTPKPVIEDMSIQTNVPALAMEEIAPLAVSDAAMLAPEEVFAGKGDIKEETELTKEERKRRRSNKKRKFKAEAVKQMAIKTQKNTMMNQRNGIEDSLVAT